MSARVAYGGRVTQPTAPGTPARPRVRGAHRWPALVVGVVAAVGVGAVHVVAGTTVTGRLVDDAAFRGALYGRSRLWQVAEPVLDVVSVPFVVGVALAAVLLALLRRRFVLAAQVAVLMVGSNVTTQVLKRLLERPDLGLGDRTVNSLPSGHTTVAASTSAALVLVVPRRWRGWAAVLGALYTTATGVSTLVGRWHRPSDVVAAVLVVLAWTGVVLAAARGGAGRTGRVRAAAALLAGAGVLGSGASALAYAHTVHALPPVDALTDAPLRRADLLVAYGGGALAIATVACLAFAAIAALAAAADPAPGPPGARAEPVDAGPAPA